MVEESDGGKSEANQGVEDLELGDEQGPVICAIVLECQTWLEVCIFFVYGSLANVGRIFWIRHCGGGESFVRLTYDHDGSGSCSSQNPPPQSSLILPQVASYKDNRVQYIQTS
jgi:hypothetical protein